MATKEEHRGRIFNLSLAGPTVLSCGVWRPTVSGLPLDVGSNQKTGKAIAALQRRKLMGVEVWAPFFRA